MEQAIKIKTVEEAIKFLQEAADINVEIITAKYRIFDEDFDDFVKDDKSLIVYAQEQQENMEADQWNTIKLTASAT